MDDRSFILSMGPLCLFVQLQAQFTLSPVELHGGRGYLVFSLGLVYQENYHVGIFLSIRRQPSLYEIAYLCPTVAPICS